MAGSAGLVSLCSAATFPFPDLPGARLESVVATPIYNFTDPSPGSPFAPPGVRVENATFCNVTVSYTHPGQNDLINVRAFLPVASPVWNHRFQAVGGGGWSPGLDANSDLEMFLALAEGYASITTDGGGNTPLPDSWALVSEGNVDLYQLQNFASVTLRDEAVIGKSLIQSFYGEGPSYSYWYGCSQGGRQGYMLAQRYPDLYDGISAAAPAIYLPAMLGSMYWSTVFINTYLDGIEPDRCELDEVTARAIDFCDALDGFEDGLIADDEACLKAFDPQSLVGSPFLCASTNQTATISQEAITFAKAVWEGPRDTDGSFLWYGPSIGAPLADSTRDSGTSGLGAPWLQYFVEKSSTYDFSNLTLEEYQWQMHRGAAEFDSIVGTGDPDLREFQRQGKKLLTYHGMADELIPEKGTRHYYNAVKGITRDVDDFYRLFEIPGTSHCVGGTGGQPATSVFDTLRKWVENGTVPDTLPITFTDSNGGSFERVVCPYPQKTLWDGVGDRDDPSSFYCA